MGELRISAPKPLPPKWEVVLWGATIAGYTASGYLRRRTYRRARMTGHDLLKHLLLRSVVGAALAELMHRWAAISERFRDEARTALAAELGREPSEDELHEALMKRSAPG